MIYYFKVVSKVFHRCFKEFHALEMFQECLSVVSIASHECFRDVTGAALGSFFVRF